MANYQIKILHTLAGDAGSSQTMGVFSASNAHTALSRALTGCDPMERMGIAHTGPKSDKLSIGDELTIHVERI